MKLTHTLALELHQCARPLALHSGVGVPGLRTLVSLCMRVVAKANLGAHVRQRRADDLGGRRIQWPTWTV